MSYSWGPQLVNTTRSQSPKSRREMKGTWGEHIILDCGNNLMEIFEWFPRKNTEMQRRRANKQFCRQFMLRRIIISDALYISTEFSVLLRFFCIQLVRLFVPASSAPSAKPNSDSVTDLFPIRMYFTQELYRKLLFAWMAAINPSFSSALCVCRSSPSTLLFFYYPIASSAAAIGSICRRFNIYAFTLPL